MDCCPLLVSDTEDRRIPPAKQSVTIDTELSYRYARYMSPTDPGFTQFTRTRNQRTYFCFNYPTGARRRLETCLRQNPQLAYREFFLDAMACDIFLKEWKRSSAERRETLVYHVCDTMSDTANR